MRSLSSTGASVYSMPPAASGIGNGSRSTSGGDCVERDPRRPRAARHPAGDPTFVHDDLLAHRREAVRELVADDWGVIRVGEKVSVVLQPAHGTVLSKFLDDREGVGSDRAAELPDPPSFRGP